MRQDTTDGRADDSAFERSLCQSAGEQIDIVDATVDASHEDDVVGRDDVAQIGEIADGR